MEAATVRPAAGGGEPVLRRAARLLRAVPWAPVFLAVVVLWILSRWIVDPGFQTLDNAWSILTAASFIAVVGAGQGLVILTGGIDLSVPWVITLGGILTTGWSNGDNGTLIWVVPAVLLVGAAIGTVNGLGVTVLRIAPVIFTIAMNSIVQGIVLVGTNGTPTGTAPSGLRSVITNKVLGIPIIVVGLVAFAIVVGLAMSRTTAGKRTYAVGNSELVAKLSGVRTRAVLIGVYAFSGMCAALAGMLLAAFSSQSFLGMGDTYLLPSIAAVVIGGASILGGRGHYIGTFGGAVFLSLLTAVLAATNVSEATREIVFGLVILLAVIAVRERRTA
jgi:ribose transport system permease protein